MRSSILILTVVAFTTAACDTSQHTASDSNSRTQPSPSAPEIKPPQVQVPQPPQIEIPQPGIPQVNIPQPGIPQVNIPQPEIPQVDIPEIQIPKITIPSIRVQENQDLTVITLPSDVLFDFDKDNIRPDADMALRQISEVLTKRYANKPLQINGHTDSVADDAYNQDLSERRAASVKRWLSEQGKVAESRMKTRGYGELQPVVPNTKPDGSDEPEGRQKNRRVEVVIQK